MHPLILFWLSLGGKSLFVQVSCALVYSLYACWQFDSAFFLMMNICLLYSSNIKAGHDISFCAYLFFSYGFLADNQAGKSFTSYITAKVKLFFYNLFLLWLANLSFLWRFIYIIWFFLSYYSEPVPVSHTDLIKKFHSC